MTLLIDYLQIQNFRSYGQIPQTVELKENGELILLYGGNGQGKSSVLDSIDYALFKKVRGRKKQYTAQNTLPNRVNGQMLIDITFRKNDVSYRIERGSAPSKLNLYIDDLPYEAKSKTEIDRKIQEVLDMDINTWKTFVSVNVNDFKNFVNMKKAEKRKILDKLFNLNIINEYWDSAKKILAGTRQQLQSCQDKASVYRSNIQALKVSNKKKAEENIEKYTNELNEIKNQIKKVKEKVDNYIPLVQEKKKELSENQSLLNQWNQKEGEHLSKLNEMKRSLQFYEKNKECPLCKQGITHDHKESITEGVKKTGKELTKEYKNATEKKKHYQSVVNETNQVVYEMDQKLFGLKSDGKNLVSNMESIKLNIQAAKREIEDTTSNEDIQKMSSELKVIEEKEKELCEKEEAQKLIVNMLQDDGIKSTLISELVEPINAYLNDYLETMNFRYHIVLDDSFDAMFYEGDEEIDIDTLSEGEFKMVNIALMFAYLSVIRSTGSTNLLFIDEVFSYIDVDNIQNILLFLREWSQRFKVNVIVVNHQLPGSHFFDRVLKVERDGFSYIVEEDASIEA